MGNKVGYGWEVSSFEIRCGMDGDVSSWEI